MMWCWLPGATLLLGDLAVRVTRWGQRGHRAVATFADCRAGVRDLEQALAGRPDWLSRITLPFVGGYMLYVPTWGWGALFIAVCLAINCWLNLLGASAPGLGG